MKIELITPEQHERMFNIYSTFPALALQNKGYEGINKDNFTDKEKAAFVDVETILKKSICGFRSFQNFRLDKNNEIQLRLQYNYNYDPKNGLPFTGVGYILLDELLNGFKN